MTRDKCLDKHLGGIHRQRVDYWSELAKLVVTGATECREMGCQRQLTVDDNTKVTSGV